jgi:BMFP domain-containing protein YqiC
MVERPKMFDDFAGMAGGALSAMSGLREELTALIRARADEVIRSLDLVRREEFDAAMALATNAKTEAEHLAARVAALEAKAAPASVYEEAVTPGNNGAKAPGFDPKPAATEAPNPMPDMSSAHLDDAAEKPSPKAPSSETPHDS